MKNNNKIIYLPLLGRIGNQLFQYAFAYTIQREYGEYVKIIIDESDVIETNWTNSLREYNLPEIEYVQEHNEYKKLLKQNLFTYKIYQKLIENNDSQIQYKREKRWQRLLNKNGLVAVERGFASVVPNYNINTLLIGYFQSEKYFKKYSDEIRQLFDLSKKIEKINYPGLDEIEKRNTVCISIKIEHNLESDIYNVCDESYYKKAIDYIKSRVENPLFFLCSDNVEKAKETFFKDYNGDIICQAKGYSTAVSLCAMSKCKHFIINNTTFGWWAQYLCENSDKIVVAPDKWKNNKDPVSVYDGQEHWHLISCNN